MNNLSIKTVAVMVAVVSLATGCSRHIAGKADAQATLEYWNEVEQPVPQPTLITRVAEIAAKSDGAEHAEAFRLAYSQFAQLSRTKAAQIASAKTVGVDVDALNYGTKKAQALLECAKLSDRAAAAVQQHEQLTSGGAWIGQLMCAGLRHAGEGESAIGSAFMDTIVTNAKSFGNLETEADSLVATMQRLQETGDELRLQEMNTRIKLSQRYGMEFPSAEAVAKQNPTPEPKKISPNKLISARQPLIHALMGKEVTTSVGAWEFESFDTFTNFNVVHGNNYGDVTDFELQAHVKSMFRECDLHLLCTFDNASSKLVLLQVL